MRQMRAKFVCCVNVTDPDTGNEVEIEIWKDPESDGLFGVDASFCDQVNHVVPSPFNEGTLLELPAEDISKSTQF
jgi:hypothetical protein